MPRSQRNGWERGNILHSEIMPSPLHESRPSSWRVAKRPVKG
jgi:hypothetical protein